MPSTSASSARTAQSCLKAAPLSTGSRSITMSSSEIPPLHAVSASSHR